MLYNMRFNHKCEGQKPLSLPYIPGNRVTLIAVSYGMPEELVGRLRSYVTNIIAVPGLQSLPRPVCAHPDMQMFIPAEGIIVHAPNMDDGVVKILESSGFIMVPGNKSPAGAYPFDIPYNAAMIGKHAFLNMKYADPRVTEWLKKVGATISHVNQGYAKCSTLILNSESVITSDHGIFSAARAQNIDVLLIPPQRKISIDCYEHGFVGGAAGLVSESEMAFAGAFETLDDARAIEAFLSKNGIKPVSLGTSRILDLGSLIPLCSV